VKEVTTGVYSTEAEKMESVYYERKLLFLNNILACNCC